MESIVNKISDLIDTYESGAWQSTENLRILLRELSANYYFLTKYNIEAHQKYNEIMYNHKGSVASGKIKAEKEVPELRMLRKIMEATQNVMWSIKSEISIIKTDK